MIKNFLFLAFICVLVSCEKEAVQPNSNDFVSTKTLKAGSSDYGDLPSELKDIVATGGASHSECDINESKQQLGLGQLGLVQLGGQSLLGTYAYFYAYNTSVIKLLDSSLPCQPNIPYFIFSYVEQDEVENSNEYSATFLLVSNPSYFDEVKVVDINWALNGQNNPVPVQSFTVDGLQIGESSSVACKVFATSNNLAVYAQEMEFDFGISIDPMVGSVVIEFESGYSYACTNTGLTPIIAP